MENNFALFTNNHLAAVVMLCQGYIDPSDWPYIIRGDHNGRIRISGPKALSKQEVENEFDRFKKIMAKFQPKPELEILPF